MIVETKNIEYPKHKFSHPILEPAIYTLAQVKDNGYRLQRGDDRYKLSDVFFGNLYKDGVHVWNTYSNSKSGSLGAIFSGIKGAGKTELAKFICNIAIEVGLPVIEVSGMQPDISIVGFIDGLSDCVILFEEFEKIFPYSMQEKMLTMFGDMYYRKKLFLATVNDTGAIVDAIMGRPGRFHYHFDNRKVDKDVIVEYCEYHKLSPKFKNDILSIWNRGVSFVMDHLVHLHLEHELYPNSTIEDMIRIINLGGNIRQTDLSIVGIVKIADNTMYVVDEQRYAKVNQNEWTKGYSIYIRIKPKEIKTTEIKADGDKEMTFFSPNTNPSSEVVSFSSNNVTETTDDGYIVEMNGFAITLKWN